MILYKYVGIDVVQEIIKTPCLKFTSPLSFNDPFDCNYPGYIENENNLFNFFVASAAKKLGLKNNDVASLKKILAPEFSMLSTEISNNLENMRKQWDVELDEFRICCLSKNRNSILMWSHYAEDHKGIAIGYDMSKIKHLAAPQAVTYASNKVRLNKVIDPIIKDVITDIVNKRNILSSDFLAGKTLQIFRHFFLVKRDEWEYEEEFRIINKASDRKEERGLVPVAKDSIAEIVFGVRTPNSQMDDVYKMAKDALPKAVFYRAIKSKGDLEIVPFDAER